MPMQHSLETPKRKRAKRAREHRQEEKRIVAKTCAARRWLAIPKACFEWKEAHCTCIRQTERVVRQEQIEVAERVNSNRTIEQGLQVIVCSYAVCIRAVMIKLLHALLASTAVMRVRAFHCFAKLACCSCLLLNAIYQHQRTQSTRAMRTVRRAQRACSACTDRRAEAEW